MIERIKLTNFRRFDNFETEIKKNIIVIHGDNARGKSSILEAISLLTNGTSPWTNTDDFISNKQTDKSKYTRIEMDLNKKNYTFYKDNSKRIFQIDNHKTTPKKFFEKNASTIFNPEQIEILMISPSKRRNFLDETIITTKYEFSDKFKNLRKVLRQRNAYLKKLSKKFYENGTIARNDTQLNFWTNEFLNISLEVQEEREKLCDQLTTKDIKMVYVRSNKKVALEDALEASKKRDIATGYTNIGPHRDDWILMNGSDVKKFGSRGEKRLAIGKLIFKKQDIVNEKLGFYPILLLDDIASELDTKNTHEVFKKETLEKQQTFLTIINYKDLPEEIIKKAQLIDLNEL